MDPISALATRPFEPTDKAFGALAGQTPAGLVADRTPLEAAGLNYPVLALRGSALDHNARAMADFCAARGVSLAPHGKTAMSPELAARQLALGAWAITTATISELRAYRSFGFSRLLLANELTDRAGLAWLAAELAADPGFDAYHYVDSPIITTASPITAHPPLPVMVEIGHEDGRTGCRTDAEAVEVAKAVAASGRYRVAGVAGYEGSIRGDGAVHRVAAFCRRLRRLADVLRDYGDGSAEFIVTAGGSAYFDIVADELASGGADGLRVVLRGGAYLFHDQGHYARITPAARGVAGAPRFLPAIELHAQVLSRPEPGLALLGFGRRDAGHDAGLPVPLGTSGWEITRLDDQHAYLRLPGDAALAPGDLVRLGISHPCTTLDKWRLVPVIDDDDRITQVVHAFF